MKTKSNIAPYVDTNALVEAVLYENEKSKKVEELIRNGATVSFLAIDELLWVARRVGRKDFSVITHELLMHPNIEFIEARCTTTLRASELMMKYNLKPRDAMHAAIMEEEGATEIISLDPDFDKIPGIRRITF